VSELIPIEVEPTQYSGPKEFVHLHLHSLFSSLDGVPSAEQYADACLKSGFPAMAATEHGHMASFPDMYFAFKKRNLKYVSGSEIYFNDYEEVRRKFDAAGKKPKSLPKSIQYRITRNRHLTVLAKNATGVSNLMKLTTLAWEDAYGGKPRIWFEKLCERKEGLIILSGCVNGPLSHELRLDIESNIQKGKPYLRSKVDKTAVEYLKNFKEAFGEDFFIEVQMPCIAELHDVAIFHQLIELADLYGVKPVITNDVHYLTRDDAYLQKIMMAVDQKTDIHDTNMFVSQGDEQFFKSRAELWVTFKNSGYSSGIDNAKFEEICDNTLLVAERCDKLAPDTSPKIPDWSTVEPGTNANDALRDIVQEQLRLRGWDKDTTKWPCDGRDVTYAEQAEIELNRFIDKGFSSYFLITRDWIQWGKKQGWIFGPRGSAAGSLVCHLLGIHNINSLKWKLSFDRFLASSRGGYLLRTKIDG
jgi:DNA polymerase-3 subunit alpha